ncbi:protein regulator of cytokinesis 1-like [Amblyomma americanum]
MAPATDIVWWPGGIMDFKMMHELGGLDNFGGLEDDILISSPSRGNGASQLSSSLHFTRGLHLEDHGQYATTTAESFVSRSCRLPLRHSAECRISMHGAEDFSDQRLEELEEELRRLKEFHAKNKPILMKVERQEALWARFVEFEKRAADPFRLNNCGGRLLLEMRERKRLEAELPRLEEEIKTHISRHTSVEDEQFFTEWAEDFLKHLSSQHEAYNLEDRERQERTFQIGGLKNWRKSSEG